MPIPEIEEFAKILVQQVRDAAVGSSERRARADAQHFIAKRWRETIGSPGQTQKVVAVLGPDIVDDTVFHFLKAIDEGALPLFYKAANGKTIDLCKEGEGEMAGWYAGSEGWRVLFSKERFIDDFADLKDFFKPGGKGFSTSSGDKTSKPE